MQFICYPQGTTCKKARAWLDQTGVPYIWRDIKTDNPSVAELRQWYAKSRLPLKRFFNSSGQPYQAQGLKDKLPHMDENEQLALLASDGMLVKRPLLISNDFVLVGFKPEEWQRTLGL